MGVDRLLKLLLLLLLEYLLEINFDFRPKPDLKSIAIVKIFDECQTCC